MKGMIIIDNRKNIIILGCHRAGKTTLTRMLMKDNDNYYHVSLDAFTLAIRKNLPEVGFAELLNQNDFGEVSQKLVSFMMVYLNWYKNNFKSDLSSISVYCFEFFQIFP